MLIVDRGGSRGEEDDAAWKWENLGQLAIGVAHDFNNLLASISGFAELIVAGAEGGIAESSAREFAKSILEAASIGQSTVKELQGLVRPGTTHWERLDLHEILGQAMAMVKGTLGGAVFLDADLPDRPAYLLGARALLHNAFINLFLNARDAMPLGGSLTVRSWFQEGGTVVSIRDNGVGMDGEVRERLFEPFHTTKGTKGTGLGLRNVQDTVRRHGGRITVETAPGQGTEFRIWLPLTA
jgi:signal transduction histidine kinase